MGEEWGGTAGTRGTLIATGLVMDMVISCMWVDLDACRVQTVTTW